MDSLERQHRPAVRTFSQLYSSTRRGARLARLLAADQFRTWGVPPEVAERAEVVVAELAANALFHGRVQGRDFRVALTHDPVAGSVLAEVTDARGTHVPLRAPTPGAEDETGRGLMLVTTLADAWGTEPCPPGGKTVWAVLTPRPPRP
ncbi:ATP-binding protein [Streptomyces sp. GSL17-111]|uniref:ATP-binding protein n=1 Tax=Streptomyces sp. GSL17-111 TaxID=3121596 RepID=UPI0030F3CF64